MQASTCAPNEASERGVQRIGFRFHRRIAEAARDTVDHRIGRAGFAPVQSG